MEPSTRGKSQFHLTLAEWSFTTVLSQQDQAYDRAHRFGQKRAVNIYKLTVANTVENRILELQEKKRALAAAALSGDKIKGNKLGMDDLLALFRPGGGDDD